MKLKSLLLQGVLIATSIATYATGDVPQSIDPNQKTFITNTHWVPDAAYQAQLRNSDTWKNFASQHGTWNVLFSEENGKPLRAYGKPISVGFSGDAQSKAYSFINNELSAFNIPVSELQYRNTASNRKYHYVNYKQFHNGLEVLWANIQVKMTLDGKIMLFGLKVYDNINISSIPALSPAAAVAGASNLAGVTVTSVNVNPDLKILPVPVFHDNVYHLVYDITVKARDENNVPSIYYTLVDANTGEVLYRQDRVNHANTDVNVTGTLYPTNPYNPSSVEPLKYLRMNVGGTNFNADNAGYLGLTNTSPVSATLSLNSPWAIVNTGGTVPSFTTTFNPGANNISFDANANIKELSAYHSVQEIHDYYKSKASGIGAIANTMDFQMTTNIDISGSCNAFYDGASINFYDAGGGCNATSLVADVIYHEYGHGINSEVYSAYGGFFGNGSLGEGYADTWANGRTEDPVLGIGFFAGNPTGFVRRYDINKKIYPQDLTGEVHANGEIIAGAWWDVALNMGDVQMREDLFLLTFAATLDEPDGSEGLLYNEVLIEALTDDDNDGDITNGTPHYCEITNGFGIHGLTLSGVILGVNHAEVLSIAPATPIDINVSYLNPPAGASPTGYYKINGAGAWTNFTMTNTGGNNFSGTIPGQSVGTIVNYYLDMTDDCGAHLGITPIEANDLTNPNIPYYVLVGFDLLNSNDLETSTAGWTVGAPGDNASTGIWTSTAVDPVQTVLSGGSTVVQTGDDHTLAPGVKCFVTGNDPSTDATVDDLDGGHTTLTSATYDLSGFTNPVFTYWRWFSNDQGSTPGTAFWQVSVSNDDGATWTDVENLNVDDHSWRRFAFKVLDYITPSANVKLRFIGSDGPSPSLVEAAIDDVELWDAVPTGINENQNIVSLNVYPNPASGQINIRWNQAEQENISIQLTDNVGKVVFNVTPQTTPSGIHSMNIPSNQFSNGVYFLKMQGENSNVVKKINVMN